MSDNNLDEKHSSSLKVALITLIVGLIIFPMLIFGFVPNTTGKNNIKTKLIVMTALVISTCPLVWFLIGQSTAKEACLPGSINQGAVFTSTLPTLLLATISACLVGFVPSFFSEPFTNLPLIGSKLGYGLAVGVNLAGASACGALICYFSVFKNGCQVEPNPAYKS